MKKLIIFVLLLNICFSQKLSAKIEKTTFGIDMDIPNDYVLVKKENYEQLKKIAEFSTQSQSQILKPSREGKKNDVDVLITAGTREKDLILIVPMPPNKLQLHNMSLFYYGNSSLISELLKEFKSNLRSFCDQAYEEIKSTGLTFSNLRIDECIIKKNKFKNVNDTIMIKYNTDFSSSLKNVSLIQYYFDVGTNGFMAQIICDKNCQKIEGALNHIVSSIK
jgi:phage pi2 protein 07